VITRYGSPNVLERRERADFAAFNKIMKRKGGERPMPEDVIQSELDTFLARRGGRPATRFGRCPRGLTSSDASKTKTRGAEQHVVDN
jgi:hypothetical protein